MMNTLAIMKVAAASALQTAVACLTVALVGGLSTPSAAAVYFSVAGSTSSNNVGYTKAQGQGGSASVGADIFPQVRLGFTYKQSRQTSQGYALKTGFEDCYTETNCEYQESIVRSTSQSVDLSVILYNGAVFTPYVFAGMGLKKYTGTTTKGTETTDIDYPLQPAPQGGAGMMIRLNKEFSLKVSYTVSPGVAIEPGSRDVRRTTDSDSEIGISYQLQ